MECRQHLTRLRNLSGFADVEEIAFDDGADAERDVFQLDLKATVARRNWSCDRDRTGLKPHPQSGCIGQALEQLRRDRHFRDETPVISRGPGQQVLVADN